MGGSGNWLKSLIPLKKSYPNDQEKKSRKWKLWRSSSSSDNGGSVKRGQAAASEASDSTAQLLDDVYSAAMASLIRAPPKDFLLIRQEWAAVRIQTAFRGLLARRASRALRAVVRIQAIFRGRMVRKQAAVTLKCMQALVRAQAQIKARRVRMALEEESLLQHKPPNMSDPPKQQPEEEWCDRRGSAEEVKTKLQMKQEAAVKRERAIAYFNSHQQARASPSLNPGRKESFSGPIKPSKSDKSSSAWSWLDGWMASSKPWDSALMEEESVNMSPLNSQHNKRASNPKPSSKSKPSTSNSMEHESVRVTRSSTTKRVTARPPGDGTHSNESLLSSSTAVEGTDETASSAGVGLSKPRYMSMTASNKAKHRGVVKSRLREVHAPQYYAKSGMRFSGEVTRTSVDSAPCSVGVAEYLYQPSVLERFDRSRCR